MLKEVEQQLLLLVAAVVLDITKVKMVVQVVVDNQYDLAVLLLKEILEAVQVLVMPVA
jgi:hypothetical protein